MKSLMLLGAILGFLIGAGFGLAGRTQWPSALWNACVAALGAGLLMRWWGSIWIRNLQSSIQQRRTRAAGAVARPAAKVPAGTKV